MGKLRSACNARRDFYHAPLAFRKSKSRLNLLNLCDALLSRVKAGPRGPFSVRMHFAILVPDTAFDCSKRRKRYVPILRFKMQAHPRVTPAQEFGSYLNFRRINENSEPLNDHGDPLATTNT